MYNYEKEVTCGPITIKFIGESATGTFFDDNDHNYGFTVFQINDVTYRRFDNIQYDNYGAVIRNFRRFLRTQAKFPATAEEIIDQFVDRYL